MVIKILDETSRSKVDELLAMPKEDRGRVRASINAVFVSIPDDELKMQALIYLITWKMLEGRSGDL